MMKDEFQYIAKDIAKMLGYTETRNMVRLIDENYTALKIVPTISGPQTLSHLSLAGVMQAINKARKLSSSEKEKLINQFTNKTVVYVGGSKEAEFLVKLERQLLVFGIGHFKRQYNVNGKKIDLYLPQVNVAIEYDENDHAGYSHENQELRQEMIENSLNCRFIRVSDKHDDETNCAIVLKELMMLGAFMTTIT